MNPNNESSSLLHFNNKGGDEDATMREEDLSGLETAELSNGHHKQSLDDGSDVFEVKTRKNRCSSKPIPSKKKSNLETISSTSSSFLNSLAYSGSTLSLNKAFFPTTSKKKDSMSSMSLSRVGGSDGQDNVKITGYLEKRSKMLGWKKYWFVLDGRLLTYYKSKSEYDSLSCCCGSINLGIASTVRPIQIRGCKGYPLQIVTRSQVYYLRSPDKQILDQWLIALQETASSQPSKISLPVWTDPGSQFFRYSFSASSQWSLNSSDDITESLSKLPPNFYLNKGSLAESQKEPHNLYKCHSFASLQSPSLYSSPTMSSLKERISSNNSSMKKKKSSKEAEDVVPVKSKKSLEQEESAGISALKEELTRKLSAGKTGESETVKPSLTKPKSKPELPFLVSPNNWETHHYDEIVDFEAIYENCESIPSTVSTTRNSANSSTGLPDIDENGDSSDMMETPTMPSLPDTGIYECVEAEEIEFIDENLTKDKKNKQNSEIRRSSGQSTKSGQSTRSEGNNRKMSGGLESNDWERTMSMSNPSTLQKSSNVMENRFSSQHTLGLDRNQSLDSESSTTTMGSKENIPEIKGKKKNKPFGGFFHKMFNRDKGKKQKEKQIQNSNQALVITGPIDLRGTHRDSPINRPTNLTIDEARKTSIKSSSPNSNQEQVIDELKGKVERIHHSIPLTRVADHILSKVSQDEEDQIDAKNAGLGEERTNSSKRNTLSRPKIPKKPQTSSKDCKNKASVQPSPTSENAQTPTSENDEILTEPVIHRRKDSPSDDFQQKLAKFNRLSERLSSTFVAAMNHPPLHYQTAGLVERSRSFKFPSKGKFAKETIPPLPPKKKQEPTPERNCYDYPTNNRPVPPEKKFKKMQNAKTCADAEKASPISPEEPSAFTFIRSLHKKNSAPDIMFSSPRSSSEDSSGTMKDEVDNVFEEILCPPPIPPKTKLDPLYQNSSCAVDEKVEDGRRLPEGNAGKQNDIASSANEKQVMKSEIGSVKANSPSGTGPGKEFNHSGNYDSQKVHEKGSNSNSATADPKSGTAYQNVKYATVNTLVQEYETVQETEDELSEMYDDFPSEYSGGSHTYETISPIPPGTRNTVDEDASNDGNGNAIRHSGMDALQMYLQHETPPITKGHHHQIDPLSSGEFAELDFPLGLVQPEVNLNGKEQQMSTPIRAGAVSRLGHSSAIDQLKRMVNYAKSDL